MGHVGGKNTLRSRKTDLFYSSRGCLPPLTWHGPSSPQGTRTNTTMEELCTGKDAATREARDQETLLVATKGDRVGSWSWHLVLENTLRTRKTSLFNSS